MKKIRSYFTYFCAIIFLVTQTSCLTYSLYQHYDDKKTSKDTIKTFSINNNKLSFFNDDYIYSFETTNQDKHLISMLKNKNNYKLNLSFDTFKIDDEDSSILNGMYHLYYIEALQSDLKSNKEKLNTINILKSEGFHAHDHTEKFSPVYVSPVDQHWYSYDLVYRKEFTGLRYSKDSYKIENEQNLLFPLTLNIREENDIELLLYILLTPLSIVADIAVTAIGSVIFWISVCANSTGSSVICP